MSGVSPPGQDAILAQRVRVWSGRLRLAHWLLAASTLALLASGWLIGASAELSQAALDYHLLAAYGLVGALALRLYLLCFGRQTEQWRDCYGGAGQWRQALATLLAYVGGGARPLPQWYGHNPLWGPVYLLWIALLCIAAWSGWDRLSGGVAAAGLHAGLAQAISIILLLHLIAVLVHELRAEHGEVSAMINGHKWFRRREVDTDPVVREQVVKLDPKSGRRER